MMENILYNSFCVNFTQKFLGKDSRSADFTELVH